MGQPGAEGEELRPALRRRRGAKPAHQQRRGIGMRPGEDHLVFGIQEGFGPVGLQFQIGAFALQPADHLPGPRAAAHHADGAGHGHCHDARQRRREHDLMRADVGPGLGRPGAVRPPGNRDYRE